MSARHRRRRRPGVLSAVWLWLGFVLGLYYVLGGLILAEVTK